MLRTRPFLIAILLVLPLQLFTYISYADAWYTPPYMPTTCYGADQTQFPSSNLFGVDNGASCGRQYSVIDHGMSLEEVEKMLKVAPVEEDLNRYSAQKLVPDAQQILLPSVENQSILWAMDASISLALYHCRIASGSPFCEFEAYMVDSLIELDLNGGFSNKGFKSAPIGFYPKGEHTVFQKTKYMKLSMGGRAENIRPSHIRRLRRRRNRDDEEDGEDNQRPSDSHSLLLILLIVLLLTLLLIVLSLILWLMS